MQVIVITRLSCLSILRLNDILDRDTSQIQYQNYILPKIVTCQKNTQAV